MSVRKYFPANPAPSQDTMIEGYQHGNAVLTSLHAVSFSLSLARDRLLFISPSATEVYGETLDTLHDYPNFWLEAIHPEDKPAAWLGMDKLLEREEAGIDFRYRLIAGDGEQTWVRQICRIAVNEAGVPSRIDCLVLPEARQLQTKAAPPSYEGIFLPVGDALLLRDPKSAAIVEANESAVELLGYRQQVVARMSWYDCACQLEGFDPRAEQAICDAALRGRPQRYEWQIQPKEGPPRWVEVVLSRVQLAGRELLLASLRDIDERKHNDARHALAVELVERGRDLVAHGNPAGQLTSINLHGRQLLDLSQEAVADLFLTDLLPNWAQPHFLHTCLPLATKDGIWRGEMTLQARNGRNYPVMLTLLAHKRGGALKGYSLWAHDVAAFKQRELHYKQAKETLEEDKLLSDKLLENVSASLMPSLDQIQHLLHGLEQQPQALTQALPLLKRAVADAKRLVGATQEFIASGAQRDLPPR